MRYDAISSLLLVAFMHTEALRHSTCFNLGINSLSSAYKQGRSARSSMWPNGYTHMHATQRSDNHPLSPRESAIAACISAGKLLAFLPVLASAKTALALDIPPFPSKGYQTKSGLRYFDFYEGPADLPTPRYGQLVSFYYTGYFRGNPSAKLDLFDSSYLNYGKEPFLHKHGNGRVLRGIDEALHTMRVGGKRRIIIPKSLGFTEFGVGPVPVDPQMRRKLGGLLDLVEADKGELVYDVELALVADDENDQGYYDDEAVSQDEVRQLVLKSLDPAMIDTIRANTPREFQKKR